MVPIELRQAVAPSLRAQRLRLVELPEQVRERQQQSAVHPEQVRERRQQSAVPLQEALAVDLRS